MKECPKCLRTYQDDSENFCLEDGSPLLSSHDPEETVVKPKLPARQALLSQALTVSPVYSPWRSHRLSITLVVVLIACLTTGVILYSKGEGELQRAQDQVAQLQMEIVSLKRKASELEAKVASMRPSNITGLRFVRVDDGTFNDDIYFVNDSGKDLEDVDVTITITDGNGVEKGERNVSGLWRNGEEHYIRVISGNHQKGVMRGCSNQGRISLAWVF